MGSNTGRERLRRLGLAAVSLVLIGVLAGCQYLDRTAVRLSSTGSLDVVSCETLDELSSAEIDYYQRTDDDSPLTNLAQNPPSRLDEGAVVSFGVVPSGEGWDRLAFLMVGSDGSTVSGVFDRASLAEDEWVWANQGLLAFFADVEHCEVLE